MLFLDLLAGQVFDRDLVELYVLDGFCDFFFHLFPAGIILQAQFPHAGLGGGCILDQPAAAKDHCALHIGGPIARLKVLIAVNGKADLIVLFQCIHFMSGLCTVKIDLILFLIVEIVDRNGKWIAVIAVDGQHAPPGLLQQMFCGFLRDLPVSSSHGSEHLCFPS